MTILFLTAIAGFLLLMAGLLHAVQGGMIYHPRPYDAATAAELERRSLPIRHVTSQGNQTAFYLAPMAAGAGPPARLWVLFHGNGSLAAEWIDTVAMLDDGDAGYLLIDYPGYGLCEGRPTPESILESSRGALGALAEALDLPRAALERDLGVIGFSLGAATALQFAAAEPVRRAVLLAPFTSMLAMARATVGWPLCHVLRHRFDNGAALAALGRRSPRPAVTIIHGDADRIVPVAMGRALAASNDWVRLLELAGLDHDIIEPALPLIREAMGGSRKNTRGVD